MDYKEKYEMALEGIQEILGSGEDSIKISRLQLRLQGIFPELKESEDERIRKRIIDALHGDVLEMSEIREAIAWLEKQGKNNMGISEATKQKLEDNLYKALEKETAESWNEFLEKQGEQKPVDPDTLIQQRVDALADIVAEQKPADKAEPKFNIGDIIFNKKN